MSNDTPRTDAEHTRLVRISEGPDWIAGKDYVDMRKHSEILERENARLREELTVQSNANVGLMEELAEAKRTDDITMTAFETLEGKFKEQAQRAEQAEAELDQCVGRLQDTQAELKQAEARALAAEKDAGRLRDGMVIGQYPDDLKYTGRAWWSGGTWLNKGEEIVVVDAAIAGSAT